MAEFRSANPETLTEALSRLLFSDESRSRFAIRQIEEARRAQEARDAYEAAGKGPTAPIPGANPEVPTGVDAITGMFMSMGGVPASISRAKPPEIERRVGGRIRDNASKYLEPMEKLVEGRLYRETSPARATEFIDPRSRADMTIEEIPLATSPSLALGQGRNRGVLLEINPTGLQGIIARNKPGLNFIRTYGEGELLGKYNQQNAYQRAVEAITIKPNAEGSRGEIRRLKGILPSLLQKGWTKTVNDDGSVTYRKPNP